LVCVQFALVIVWSRTMYFPALPINSLRNINKLNPLDQSYYIILALWVAY